MKLIPFISVTFVLRTLKIKINWYFDLALWERGGALTAYSWGLLEDGTWDETKIENNGSLVDH